MILNTTALPYSWHFVNSRRTTGECQTINSHPKSINYLFVLDNSEGIEGSNANLWLWERHMGSLWTAFPRRSPDWSRGTVWGGAVEMKCHDLTTNLHPPSPCAPGKEVEELGEKPSQARRLFSFLFLAVLLQ